MTKKQKIWLLVSSGMFLVPEILFNPIGNSLYSLINDVPFRNNFLMNSDNRILLIFIVLFQYFGISTLLIFLFKDQKYKVITEGRLVVALLCLLNLATLFVLYILFATKNMFS
jgi:hypothetical protein